MAAQTYTSIDSTAATADTQLSTAHVQLARQNSRWLKEWRGPETVLTFPIDVSAAGGPSPATFAFASWAAVIVQRWFCPLNVPAGGLDVNVTLAHGVSTRAVKVAVLSKQGYGGAYSPVALNALATTIAVGDTSTTFAVHMVPGWNDVLMWLESEADWDGSAVAYDWRLETSSGTPLLFDSSASGDLAVECALITAAVPFIGVRMGIGQPDKDHDAVYGAPVTIGWVAESGGKFPYATIAEWPASSMIPPQGMTTPGFGLLSFQTFYWSSLGTMTLRSVTIAPYAVHPDATNDPMLRWYQLPGSNVADVAWEASTLQNMRQPQWCSVTQRAIPYPYPGVWRVGGGLDFYDADPAIFFTVRESAMLYAQEQPPGPVYLECSWPAAWVDPRSMSLARNGGPVSDPATITWRLDIYDPATATVVAYVDGVDLHRPLRSQLDGGYFASHWVRLVNDQIQGAAYVVPTGIGQPFSHDGALAPVDADGVFTPGVLRLRVDTLGLSTSAVYIARLRVRFDTALTPAEAFIGPAILATGPATWRLDWGTYVTP